MYSQLTRYSPSLVHGRSLLALSTCVICLPRHVHAGRAAHSRRKTSFSPSFLHSATSDAPRLVFSYQPPSLKKYAYILPIPTAFYAGVAYLSFVNPSIPHWWGFAGMGACVATYAAMWLRMKRTVTELAVYPNNSIYRLSTQSISGEQQMMDVPIADIGPNLLPSSKSPLKYWSIRIKNRQGYYLLFREGLITDVDHFALVLGYDVHRSVAHDGKGLSVANQQDYVQAQQESVEQTASQQQWSHRHK